MEKHFLFLQFILSFIFHIDELKETHIKQINVENKDGELILILPIKLMRELKTSKNEHERTLRINSEVAFLEVFDITVDSLYKYIKQV